MPIRDSEPPPKDFRDVAEAHWDSVYRTALTLTGQVCDAEDLTQETMLRALNSFHQFKAGTKLRAWLLQIAHNAFVDDKRKEKRRGVVPLEAEPITSQAPVDHNMIVAEDCQLLKVALTEISPAERLVFHLRVTEGLSFKEIAGIIETTEETARGHMFQARKKLARRLGPQMNP